MTQVVSLESKKKQHLDNFLKHPLYHPSAQVKALNGQHTEFSTHKTISIMVLPEV